MTFFDPFGFDRIVNGIEYDEGGNVIGEMGLETPLIDPVDVLSGGIAGGMALRATKAVTCPLIQNVPQSIKISQRVLNHVRKRHGFGSKTARTSKFGEDVDISTLVRKAEGVMPRQQSGGNFERIVNAGETIGIDRATGHPTSIYSVITDRVGNLVTAFPGLP